MDYGNKTFMGEYPVGKLLWKMSVPATIAISFYNVYNIIDTVYIARGVGLDAAGGLAVSFPLFIFLSAVTTTLGSGAASVMSRAFGQKDFERADKTAANTFGLFYLIALLITVFGLVFLDDLLSVMGVTQELLPYTKNYTRIILFGTVTSTAFSSLIRAEGHSTYAMYVWVVPMIANLILDPILIFGFHLGVTGAAAATVSAQVISVIMSLYYFFLSGKSLVKLRPRHFVPDSTILREVIFIGLPPFIQLAGYSLLIIIVNQLLKKYGGALPISIYGIVNKITTFIIIPINGIVQGLQPIVGYNYGAGQKERVMTALKKSILAAGSYGCCILFIVLFFSENIMHLFISDREALLFGSYILKIVNAGVIFSGIQSVQSAYFQATGKKMISIALSLCNPVCFIPVVLLMSDLYGLDGIWYAFPATTLLIFFISSAVSIISIRKERYGAGKNITAA